MLRLALDGPNRSYNFQAGSAVEDHQLEAGLEGADREEPALAGGG
jgi:hypothetical protein